MCVCLNDHAIISRLKEINEMSSKGAEITTVVTEVKKIEGWKYGLKGKNKKIWVRRNIEY